MKKPVHTVLRRKRGEPSGTMSVYNDSRWEVPHGYPPRPEPPEPPRPPHPEPWRPTPVDPENLKIGMGLQLEDNVLSVKVDGRGFPGISVTPNGISINDVLRKLGSQERKINELAEIIVDLKDQINRLKLALSPSAIARILVEEFDIFGIRNGKLTINLGNGLVWDRNGNLSVNAGTGLKFENGGEKIAIDPDRTITVNEENNFGVNVDNDTIRVNATGQLTANPETNWREYITN